MGGEVGPTDRMGTGKGNAGGNQFGGMLNAVLGLAKSIRIVLIHEWTAAACISCCGHADSGHHTDGTRTGRSAQHGISGSGGPS